MSANVEAAKRQIRELISGRSAKTDWTRFDSDIAIRQAVSSELLAAMSRSNLDEQERARELFVAHGYFDETINALRAADSADERASAAHTLGVVGSRLGTAHLIAAVFDSDAGVRQAAGEALGKIGDPSVTDLPVSEILSNGIVEETREVHEPLPVIPETMVVEEATMSVFIEEVSQVETSAFEQPDEGEAESLHIEEDLIRRSIVDLDKQLREASAAQKEAWELVRLRNEEEAAVRAKASALRREEGQLRRRLSDEAERLMAAQVARAEAEEKVLRFEEEDTRLREEAEGLRKAVEELAHRRHQIEAARRETLAAAQRAEADRARNDAEVWHKGELERIWGEEEAFHQTVAERQEQLEASRLDAQNQLQNLVTQISSEEAAFIAESERVRRDAEERNRVSQAQLLADVEALRQTAEEVSVRRKELENARQTAEQEAQELREAQARMKAAAEERRAAESERLRLEADIALQVETEKRLLEESRRRAEEEEQKIEEAARLRAEEEEYRLGELEALRKQTESEVQHRAKREQQLRSLIETLETAEAEALSRIEEAEVRRRTVEETHRLAEEKAQRMEAEAHVSALEEEQVLAKLEAVRRNVALEAQGRTEQEKRIKEEIEQLRRLEDEQRHRIDMETRRRAEAESRLQQQKELYRMEEEARAKAELEIDRLAARYEPGPGSSEWHDDPAENLRPLRATVPDMPEPFTETPLPSAMNEATAIIPDDEACASTAIFTELGRTDPDQRVAALADLAQFGSEDAFTLIADCFDNQTEPVRNAAARALRTLEPQKCVELFNRALDEGNDERKRNIGVAIANSGLANEAIDDLNSESREETYNALCLLFVMAKTGQVEPLVKAIEGHPNFEVRRAVIKLLTLSGQSEIADAAVKRRLDARP